VCKHCSNGADALPAPVTLAHCVVNSSVVDDPTSCTLGTTDQASVSLTLSPFVSLSAQAASPAAAGVHGASGVGNINYSFQVIGGNPGDVVPILIDTTLTTISSGPAALAIGFASLTVNTGVVGTTTLKAVCTDGSCGTTDRSFSGTLMTRARSGGVGDFLELHVSTGVTGSLTAEFASATADPFIFIDPAFPGASLYSIVVSPGVGNVAAVPESASVSLVTLGGLMLGAVGLRRRRRNSVS